MSKSLCKKWQMKWKSERLREWDSWEGGERPRLSTLRHMAVSFLITLQLAGRLPALCVCVRLCLLLHMLVCVCVYVSKSSCWSLLKITRYHLTSVCVCVCLRHLFKIAQLWRRVCSHRPTFMSVSWCFKKSVSLECARLLDTIFLVVQMLKCVTVCLCVCSHFFSWSSVDYWHIKWSVCVCLCANTKITPSEVDWAPGSQRRWEVRSDSLWFSLISCTSTASVWMFVFNLNCMPADTQYMCVSTLLFAVFLYCWVCCMLLCEWVCECVCVVSSGRGFLGRKHVHMLQEGCLWPHTRTLL